MTHETEVDLAALPNEAEEILSAKVKHARLVKLNEAKTQVLWDLSRGRGNSDCDASVQREIVKWSRLTDKYLQRMAEVRMRCRFCDDKLTGANVNTSCSLNAPGKALASVARDVAIPPGLIGTSRHFWVNPNLDAVKKAKERIKKELEVAEQTQLRQMQEKTTYRAGITPASYSASYSGAYTATSSVPYAAPYSAIPRSNVDPFQSSARSIDVNPLNYSAYDKPTRDRPTRYTGAQETLEAPTFFESFKSQSSMAPRTLETEHKPSGNPYLNTSTYKSLNWSVGSQGQSQ